MKLLSGSLTILISGLSGYCEAYIGRSGLECALLPVLYG